MGGGEPDEPPDTRCMGWGSVGRQLEQRLTAIIVDTAHALFPELGNDRRLPALLDAAVSLIRGLVMAIPVSGREVVDRRWAAIKPLLLEAAAELLDT